METQLESIKKNINKSYKIKKKFKSKLEKLYNEHKLIKYIKKHYTNINLQELIKYGKKNMIYTILQMPDKNCVISDESLSNFITDSKLITNNDCIICYDKTHVYSLTCNDKHTICPECYDQLYDHYNFYNNEEYKKCPFCREPSYEIPFIESFIEYYFD